MTVTAEKLLTYALGRGVEHQDMPLVRQLSRDAAEERQSVLGARPRRRQEPAVPDEYAGQDVTAPRQQAAAARPTTNDKGNH